VLLLRLLLLPLPLPPLLLPLLQLLLLLLRMLLLLMLMLHMLLCLPLQLLLLSTSQRRGAHCEDQVRSALTLVLSAAVLMCLAGEVALLELLHQLPEGGVGARELLLSVHCAFTMLNGPTRKQRNLKLPSLSLRKK